MGTLIELPRTHSVYFLTTTRRRLVGSNYETFDDATKDAQRISADWPRRQVLVESQDYTSRRLFVNGRELTA